MTPKILVFAGSTRAGSYNMKLADCVTDVLFEMGVDVTHLKLADYPLPVFNEDIEKPENAHLLAKLFSEADGLIIASPEYNSSLTPLLKNTLDWVSVIGGEEGSFGPYKDKMCLLTAASPGGGGGLRGLYHLRSVLMNVGAEVITSQVAVPNAGSAFGDDGHLTEERVSNMLKGALSSLLLSVNRAKAVPRQ